MATNVLAGMQYVQQQGELGRQQGEQRYMKGLAPQVIAGDPAAFDKMAAVSPQAAQAAQGVGDDQLRRLKGALDYFEQGLQSGDDRLIQARFREISPFVSKLTGQPAPGAWSEEMRPAFEQVKTKIAMANQGNQSGMPAGFQQFELTARAAGLVPGSPEYQQAARIALGQEGRAATGGYGFELVDGPDGRKRMSRKNPRTGAFEIYNEQTGDFEQVGSPASSGGQQPPAPQGPQPGTYQTPTGIVRVGNLTPDQWATAQADINGGGAVDNVTLPQRDVPPTQFGARANPGLAVGRSPEEQAALTEQAKTGVQLANLPAELSMRTNAAVDQAVRTDQGKAQAERAAAAPATIATMQNSLDSIDALLADPELGSIVGLSSLNPLNKIPGSKARGLAARADQVAGQAFLAAFNQLKGGGAITEREGAAATAAMARLDRSQSEEDYRLALTDLRTAIMPAMERARQQAQGGQSPAAGGAVQRATNPQTGQVIELRNGQWVPAQ